MFTLSDKKSDTETDKMVFIGLCGGVYTAQKPRTTQIPIESRVLVLGISLDLSVSGSVNGPQHIKIKNRFKATDYFVLYHKEPFRLCTIRSM